MPSPASEYNLEAEKLPVKLPAVLERQSHGGALLRGGIPGHRGAGGRPPKKVRAMLRGLTKREGVAYAREVLKVARERVRELDPKDRRHAEAMDVLNWAGKFGVGEAPAMVQGQAQQVNVNTFAVVGPDDPIYPGDTLVKI